VLPTTEKKTMSTVVHVLVLVIYAVNTRTGYITEKNPEIQRTSYRNLCVGRAHMSHSLCVVHYTIMDLHVLPVEYAVLLTRKLGIDRGKAEVNI
jgi:hypothetical protein